MNFKVDLTHQLKPSFVSIFTAIPVFLFLLIAIQSTFNNLRIGNPLFANLNSLTNDPVTGHATTLGFIVFYIVVLGLPLAGLLNLLRVLNLNIKLSAWKLSGEVDLKPHFISIFLAVTLTLIGGIFLGHLAIDQIACSLGNVSACD